MVEQSGNIKSEMETKLVDEFMNLNFHEFCSMIRYRNLAVQLDLGILNPSNLAQS